MSAPPRLRDDQGLFWGLIAAPEGVRRGLETLVGRGAARPGDLDALIVGDERLSSFDRLDIYANMYFFRLLDCLKEDYPRLLEALGPARFHNLVTDYLLVHPSSHPSLRHVGTRLADFLAGHALESECPGLADLARLEWARADIFDAADARPLARADLAALPQDTAGEARLALVPACRLLRLAHDAARAWRELKERADGRAGAAAGGGAGCAHGDGDHADPPPRIARRPTAVRVWRHGFAVHHRSIDDDEIDSLEGLRAGDTLGVIAQRLSAGRTPERATARLGALLQGWIEDALIAAVRTE
jgi:hypothetical protein